jgi:hypothetical protein
MKLKKLLENWDAGRIIRMVIGIGISAHSVFSEEYLFLLLGVFLILQSILNWSCCCAGACGTGIDPSKHNLYKNQVEPYNPKEK